MAKKTTPMMEQYRRIKATHRDMVLFFRLGDFYEMFDDDAIEVSRLLQLTLTHRGDSPMCGVPHHAAKNYLARLLQAGKKIAICEQVSDPVPGELTERQVVEVYTPGTTLEDAFLNKDDSNYLAALCRVGSEIGFAYIDISTSDFFATTFSVKELFVQLKKELARVCPREILIQQSLADDYDNFELLWNEYPKLLQNYYPDWSFDSKHSEELLCKTFGTENLKAFGIKKNSALIPAAGLLIDYLEQTSHRSLSHIQGISIYNEDDFVTMDEATQKNLELLENLHDHGSRFVLFEVINHTKTAMGKRLLRRHLSAPLKDVKEINKRLDGCTELYNNERCLSQSRDSLTRVLDVERLVGRIAMNKINPKDTVALKQSLKEVLFLIELFKDDPKLFSLDVQTKKEMVFLYELLEHAIQEDCSHSLKDGNIIKAGYSKEFDELISIRDNAHQVLEEYLLSEREKTGINNLKIKYNRLHGYFLEVSKGNLSHVPSHFIFRRALSNTERYTTEALDALEGKILGAETNILEMEKTLFYDILEKIRERQSLLYDVAHRIAVLDVLQSNANTALKLSWQRPQFSESGIMDIQNGRHPVVEAHLPTGEFIPNSIALSSNSTNDTPAFALITGPNMAGKSTFLRQTALIVLLAQIGSYVPAEKAVISPVDKIFCRVGASDNLARGESTFLVEMSETAHILRTATKDSLIIMDEVGRGTSTEDGRAIAQAVIEYLLASIKAKTLFATHYHELAQLEHDKLRRFCLSVNSNNGKIVFLKKLIEGVAENSYGIHVARLAGVPESVLNRANHLIDVYASKEASQKIEINQQQTSATAPALFSTEELVIDQLLSIDPNRITPLDALSLLTQLKDELNKKKY